MTRMGIDIAVERALTYSHSRGVPSRSYLYVNGVCHQFARFGSNPIADGLLHEKNYGLVSVQRFLRSRVAGFDENAITDRRTTVAVFGANRAPSILRHLFPPKHPERKAIVIPVVRAWLIDFEVVHAAQIQKSANLGATLRFSPGTHCEIALMSLERAQLDSLNEFEGVYNSPTHSWSHLARLSGVRIVDDGGTPYDRVLTHISNFGALRVGCGFIGASHGSSFSAAPFTSQKDAQRIVEEMTRRVPVPVPVLRASKRFEGTRRFICENYIDANVRSNRNLILARENSAQFSLPKESAAEHHVVVGSTELGDDINVAIA